MDSKQILTKELSRLQQQEAELRLSLDQKMLRIHIRRETILSKLLPDYCPNKSVTETFEKSPAKDRKCNPTKNTCTVFVHKLSDIDENDFDVILDMTTTSLRYRENPAKHTKLQKSELAGIGQRRIEILAYILEHPSKNISIENASLLHNQPDIIEPNTLSKTIGLLRKALGQKGSEDTYIITENVWGRHYRSAYRVNKERRYLVIRKK